MLCWFSESDWLSCSNTKLDIACWPDTCMRPPGTHHQQGNLIGTHCPMFFTCSQFILTALGSNWSDQLRGMAESKQYTWRAQTEGPVRMQHGKKKTKNEQQHMMGDAILANFKPQVDFLI